MKVLFYSSINIDTTFVLDHLLVPGESQECKAVRKSAGGKGENQCAAFAKAGRQVYLSAKVSDDAKWIIEKLKGYGVNTSFVSTNATCTGQAFIQVDSNGQNSIAYYPGGNHEITFAEIDSVLADFNEDDVLFLNAEINNLDYIFSKALYKGMKIIVNPSPVNEAVLSLPLDKCYALIVNEVEGKALTGKITNDFEKILSSLVKKFPNTRLVLTCGSEGSWFSYEGKTFHQDIFPVKAVDTTGAGDTFLGYFFSSYLYEQDAVKALQLASKASSIAVTRPGAMEAIPLISEIVMQ